MVNFTDDFFCSTLFLHVSAFKLAISFRNIEGISYGRQINVKWEEAFNWLWRRRSRIAIPNGPSTANLCQPSNKWVPVLNQA